MLTMKILQPYFLTLRKEKNSKKFGKYGLYVRQAIYIINAIILDAFSLVLNCKLALKSFIWCFSFNSRFWLNGKKKMAQVHFR